MNRPHSNDDRISAMIANSDFHPMTAEQEAEASEWLAGRVAVVRKSHQLFPSPPQGDDEMISARSAYQRANMNCEPHYRVHVPTLNERWQISALRSQGMSISRIARDMGFDNRTVRKAVGR